MTITLDAKSNDALRDEIAERLRALLARDQTPLPARLRALVARLGELDQRVPSPSIVANRSPTLAERWRRRRRAAGRV